MRKLIFILLFIPVFVSAQIYQRVPQSLWMPRLKPDSVLSLPLGLGSLRNLSDGRDTGQIRYYKTDSSAYVWTGYQWRQVGGATYSGTAPVSVSGTVISLNTVPINKGGTNNSSLSVVAGTLYYGDGTKLIGLTPGTSSQVLHGGTTPSWKDTTASGGSTPTLQQVTDAGNTTTNTMKTPAILFHDIGNNKTVTVQPDDLDNNYIQMLRPKSGNIALYPLDSTATPENTITIGADGYFHRAALGGSSLFPLTGTGTATGSVTGDLASNTLSIMNGNVGIGSSSAPDSALTNTLGLWSKRGVRFSGLIQSPAKYILHADINGNVTYADTTAITATSPAGNYGNLQINRNGVFATPASDSLNFNSTNGLTVLNKLGISTTSPDSTLTVVGSGRFSTNLKVGSATAGDKTFLFQEGTSQTSTSFKIYRGDGTAYILGNSANSKLSIYDGSNSNAMEIGFYGMGLRSAAGIRYGDNNTGTYTASINRIRDKWIGIGNGNLADSTGSITLDTIRVKSNATIGGTLTQSGNGALSAPAIAGTGTWITGGSATTTKPYVLIEPTGTTSTGWNTSGTGLGINAASGFVGYLFDAQIAGVSKFTIANAGAIHTGYLSGGYFRNGNNNFHLFGANTGTGTIGALTLYDGSESGAAFLQMGGTSSSYPGISRNGTGIDIKLADNSAYTGIQSLYDRFGSGSPESVVTAPVGAVYHRTDGGAGTSYYVKESGSGNTGWVAK